MSTFPVVCYGEILWDYLPQGKLAGGAPVNVAYHLKQLGKNPAVITRIGEDEEGKELKESLEQKKIETDFFQTDSIYSTGKVIADIKDHEVVYDIVKPVAWDFIEWKEEYFSLIKESKYFVFGSLVSRNEASRKTLFQCLEVANKKVLDINLRPPHFDKKVLQELMQKADVLKLNSGELSLISEWFNHFKNDEGRIKSLKEDFNINTIIVTKGGDGAILYRNDIFYDHKGYNVSVADTIGSGDAFLAAMISSFIDNASENDSLEFANALGAFIASRSGGCPAYELNEVRELIKK
ncbi:MAG TPA: carbohydrate kinase [Hanamia sp.]|nr:carbohydrate kinase [Hanamia sp.]